MKQFVRDALVFHISVTFLDSTGAIVTPTGANVTLSFVPKNHTSLAPERTFITYALVAPSSPATDWTYDWDSSIAGTRRRLGPCRDHDARRPSVVRGFPRSAL